MTSFSIPYRDSTEGERIRYEELHARWIAQGPARLSVRDVYATRVGRIWAGNAGIACAGLIAVTTLLRFTFASGLDGWPTFLLPISWIIVLAAFVVGGIDGRVRARAFIAPPQRTRDARSDASRMEAAFAHLDPSGRVDELEHASVARPMMAVALLAPLSLHLVVALLSDGFRHFDGWIALSGVLVGHAHLVLVYQAHAFAKTARLCSWRALNAGGAGSGWAAYGYAVFASAIPGAILFLLPPLIAAVTGIVIVRPMYAIMTRKLVGERVALEEASKAIDEG